MLTDLPSKLSGSKKTKVFLDTNILLLPGQAGLDVFSQLKSFLDEPFELCTVSQVFEELLAISKGETIRRKLFFFRGSSRSAKGADKRSAKLGYVLAKQKDLKTVGRSSKKQLADDAILSAVNKHSIVVTLDKKLQDTLKSKGVRVVTVRQGKYFTFVL
ncbi:MAG: PIN domain-containing protein [Nanobdellota archaeon]